MNGFDLVYCTNTKCGKEDCRRYYKKIPKNGYVDTSKFNNLNCKYYVKGTCISDRKES